MHFKSSNDHRIKYIIITKNYEQVRTINLLFKCENFIYT